MTPNADSFGLENSVENLEFMRSDGQPNNVKSPIPNPQSTPENSLSPVKRALLALETMQAKLDALEYAKKEPIAIIGMGCRFPGGADNPEAFWNLCQDGVDAIAPIPADRWNIEKYYDPNPDAPGKTYAREGGFLDRVDRFNPQFFGISAREAVSMDPQQRLLLEVGWEAIENAAYAPEQLQNSATGVFLGIYFHDYNRLMWELGEAAPMDAFCATGNANSIAAGRLSYTLGLKGPSLAIDTACSSSLVSVHLACQSLRLGECNMALAGGVSLLLAPDSTIALSQAKMLAPDDRCKTFDAEAKGFVKGEGCGIIVLKRLSDALTDNDNILAVIRGSAVNHNGRSSSLIAPNGLSQQAAIRGALENGGIDPTSVNYVEVQGTSTALGEPIEVEALAAVYSKNRPSDRPLIISSVKTNIGHLEAAAGIASLIKVVMALQHGEIPPHLHFKQPNPYIDWDKLHVKVPTNKIPWPATEKRLAGVSAFGFSGTNAHVIISDFRLPIADLKFNQEKESITNNNPKSKIENPKSPDRPLHLLTLSAKTESALIQLAQHYEKYLAEHPDLDLGDICYTANYGRSHFQYRLSAVASSSTELREQLIAFSAKQETEGLFSGKAIANPKIAFLFTGEGSDDPEIADQLYQTQPTFRQAWDLCHEILHSHYQLPITNYRLPITQYALFQLWKSWGIEPTAIMGYGSGEYVAACVAGVFSLEDALKLTVERGRLMQLSSQKPDAFYSPLPETIELGEFDQIAQKITYSQPQIPLVSNLTGELATAEICTPSYWCRQIRQPVNFASSMETLHRQGCEIFLEIGPNSDLSQKGDRSLSNVEEIWLASLNPILDDWQQMLVSLAILYIRGVKVNWSGFDRDYARHRLQLPTYPWERQRYWLNTTNGRSSSQNTGDLETRIQQLKDAGKLSEAELQLLPKLLELLTTQTEIDPASIQPVDPTTLTAEDIKAWLVSQIAKELGVKPDEIDIQAPFDSYGLDSILVIGIASAAEQFLGLELSFLLLLRYPTIELLSQHLAAEFERSDSEIFVV
jgi:acyl transferase domain-containing protein/acyl carrier protein